ncbi:hypothetical protein MUG91_G873n1, partial [Manis pentadactyla]
RSGDTPQENTDSSATLPGPHANEGTGTGPPDGTLHPDTLTRAASLFCRQPTPLDELFWPPQEIFCPLSAPLSPCPWDRQITGTGSSGRLMELCTLTPSRVRLHLFSADSRVDPEKPHKKILILLQHVSAPMPAGDREQWPLDGTLHLTPSRVRPPLLQTAESRSGDTPQENTDSSATRLGPHVRTGSSGRLMELCTLTPSRVRLHLFCRREATSSLFQLPCQRLYPLIGPSGDPETPHKKILGFFCNTSRPHAYEGTGSSGRLMELCTLTPSRVRLPLLQTADFRFRIGLLKTPEIFCPSSFPVSVSLGSPQITVDPETPHKKIRILLQHVGPHANEGTGSSGRLMELCTLTPSRVRPPLLQTADLRFEDEPPSGPNRDLLPLLVPLSPCPFDRLRSRSRRHPTENTVLLQHVWRPPHASRDREQWPLDGTLHPDTLTRTLYLFCRQPTSVSDEPPSGPHRVFCVLLVPVSVSLGSPQITPSDEPLGPHRDLLPASRSTVSVSFGAPDHGRSGDTPQENTDSCATRLGPHANEGTGNSGRLMELCTLTPSRVRLHLFCRQPSRSGDTPQENTDSSATRLGPHANEGTGSSGRLMELCTLTPSRVRLHLFCRQPSRSGDTPQENTDSSATRPRPPCQRGGQEQGRLMELCTPTPSRVRLLLFWRQPTSALDEPPSGPHRDLLPAFRSTVSVSWDRLRSRFRWMSSFGPHRDLLPASRSTVSVSLGSPQITVDPETPHKKILILLQHVSGPMPMRGPGAVAADGTLHPDTSRVRLHLFCRQPTSWMSSFGAPPESFARFSPLSPCPLGSPRSRKPPEA